MAGASFAAASLLLSFESREQDTKTLPKREVIFILQFMDVRISVKNKFFAIKYQNRGDNYLINYGEITLV